MQFSIEKIKPKHYKVRIEGEEVAEIIFKKQYKMLKNIKSGQRMIVRFSDGKELMRHVKNEKHGIEEAKRYMEGRNAIQIT